MQSNTSNNYHHTHSHHSANTPHALLDQKIPCTQCDCKATSSLGWPRFQKPKCVADNLPHISFWSQDKRLVETLGLAVTVVNFSKHSHHDGGLIRRDRFWKRRVGISFHISHTNNNDIITSTMTKVTSKIHFSIAV